MTIFNILASLLAHFAPALGGAQVAFMPEASLWGA